MFDVVPTRRKRTACFETSKDNRYFFTFDGSRGHFPWLYHTNAWKLSNPADCAALKNLALNSHSNTDHQSCRTTHRPKGLPQFSTGLQENTSQLPPDRNTIWLVDNDTSEQVNNNTWRNKHSKNLGFSEFRLPRYAIIARKTTSFPFFNFKQKTIQSKSLCARDLIGNPQ